MEVWVLGLVRVQALTGAINKCNKVGGGAGKGGGVP